MIRKMSLAVGMSALILTATPAWAKEEMPPEENAEIVTTIGDEVDFPVPEETAEDIQNAAAEVWNASEDQGTEGFVERLYQVVLGRASDAAGKADWVHLLKSGDASGSEAAAGFFTSPEYMNSGKTDEKYVEDLYQAILGRSYDAAGKKAWLSLLTDGISRKGILAGFTGSQEFQGLCDSYGIACGKYFSDEPRDQNEKVTAFVQRLYREVLGRNGDESGLNDWTKLLLDGTASGAEVAADFIGSPEYQEKNTENTAFVEMLYRTMLDRQPDPEGMAHWCEALEEGKSRYDILAGFVFSEEFGKICESYGIERGESVPGRAGESAADAVARIAAAEIGYHEIGNNRTKYNQWMYGSDMSAPWCSIFICWCVNEAGAGGSIQNTAIASGYRTSNMGSNPFGAPAYAFSSTEPQPGDIVFIDNTGNGISNHTGLVVDVDEDYIYTAEGNYSDKVSSCRYRRSNGYQVFASGSSSGVHILFYVRPDYQH